MNGSLKSWYTMISTIFLISSVNLSFLLVKFHNPYTKFSQNSYTIITPYDDYIIQ